MSDQCQEKTKHQHMFIVSESRHQSINNVKIAYGQHEFSDMASDWHG